MPREHIDGSEGRSAEELDAERRTREAYEQLPYRGRAYPNAQPAHLEVIAKLFGVDAPAADGARMLEIGCGDAMNLIPLAVAHPRAHFHGLDLAKGHIDSARALVERLGLENVELRACSFTELGESDGPFDYVVAHGLMSWITPSLQAALFDRCKRLLAPEGVAFISYNTFPGWHALGSIRALLRRMVGEHAELAVRIARARALLEHLLEHVPEQEAGHRGALEYVHRLCTDPARAHYFGHEFLEDQNNPFFVDDFIARAEATGLRYLADAEVNAPLDPLPDALAPDGGDYVQRLALLDMKTNRRFRQSLLCHADRPAADGPEFGRIFEMYVSSRLYCKPDSDGGVSLEDGVPLSFSDSVGRGIEADEAVIKAALLHFQLAGPHPVHFPELLGRAYGALGLRAAPPMEAQERDASTLARTLGRLFLLDLVTLRACPPCWAAEPSERPLATPLARMEDAPRSLSSLAHRTVDFADPAFRATIRLCDGHRDRDAILASLREQGIDSNEADLDRALALAAHRALLLPAPPAAPER